MKLIINKPALLISAYTIRAVGAQVISSNEDRDNLPIILEINSLKRDRNTQIVRFSTMLVCAGQVLPTLWGLNICHKNSKT